MQTMRIYFCAPLKVPGIVPHRTFKDFWNYIRKSVKSCLILPSNIQLVKFSLSDIHGK